MNLTSIFQYVSDAYKLQSWALAGILSLMLVAGLRKFNWCPNRIIWVISMVVCSLFTTVLAPPAPIKDAALQWRLTNIVIGCIIGGLIELFYSGMLAIVGKQFPWVKEILDAEAAADAAEARAADPVPTQQPPTT